MKLFIKKTSILIILSLLIQANIQAEEMLEMRQNFNSELQSVAGSLVSSSLYSSYISIDLLAQKISDKDFDFKRDKNILSSLEMITENLDEVLKTMYSVTDSKKDAKVIYDLVELTKKIKGDAELLLEFAKNRKTDILEDYNNHHMQTWTDMKNYFSGKIK